jgi:GDPmannose 4,6-dehydratase
LARIKLGIDEVVYLGNLDARRDWGFAKDYVEGMWMMLQQPKPDDYILATNESHSVREFVEESAKILGFNIKWQGHKLDEEGVDSKTGKVLVRIDPTYYRPAEVELLNGDYDKAKSKMGWKPKLSFDGLVKLMVDADLKEEKLRIQKND